MFTAALFCFSFFATVALPGAAESVFFSVIDRVPSGTAARLETGAHQEHEHL
mgnify:CR=1 FL=1